MRTRILAILVATLTLLLPALLPAPALAETEWTDTRTTWKAPGNNGVRVVGLRYATHDRFDRVVIDIRGRFPDYRTGYASRFTYDGSGAPVPIRARSGLWISLSAVAHDADGHNLYTGPRIARPRFETLKALAFTGDFEGHVSFAFALRHRATYRVLHLSDPNRVVIDFRHR